MPVNLGMAQGEIVISTTGVIGAQRVVKGAAASMTRDLAGVSKGVGGLQDAFRKFDSFLGASFAVGAAVGVGKMVLELGKASAQAELTEKSFQGLAAGVGASGDALLDSMRTASRGVITDSALIMGANRAIVGGVADDAAEMNQILEIARATGQAFGFTTSEAFDKIVRGVSKLEPELLDELGIMVRLDDVFRSYATSIGTTAAKLTDLQKRQALLEAVIRKTQPTVDAAAGSMDNDADKYNRMGVAVDNLKKSFGDLINTGGGGSIVSLISADIDRGTGKLKAYIALLEQLERVGIGLAGAFGFTTPNRSGTAPWGTRGAPPTLPGAPPPRFDDKQTAILVDRDRAARDIDDQATSDALDAKRDYADQLGDIERDYQQSSSREAQDFATSRLRAEADFAKSLADLHRDAARREQDQAEDFARANADAQENSAERIADARKDAGERLVEMEEDYAKNRERAAADHRDKMMSAAGRLDAVALLEERKRWARESEDAKDAHTEQRDDLNEALAERIADEQEALAESNADRLEAYNRQLEDARENDAMREADMIADFEARKILEDEDRALRLGRMAEDHQARLDEMARQHQLDLEQIRTNKAEERAKLQEQFDIDMDAAGIRTDAFIKEQNRGIANAIASYDLLNKRIAWAAAGLVGTGAIGLPGAHPSAADPYVDMPMVQGSSMWTGGGMIKQITIAAGAITINGDGLNEREVVDVMIDYLEKI